VEGVVSLFLCGDVMLGRGVDQILPHPGHPALRERGIRDARRYVELAESVNGEVPRPVDFAWPWGDAPPTLNDIAPDLRLIGRDLGAVLAPNGEVGQKGEHDIRTRTVEREPGDKRRVGLGAGMRLVTT
jgi:poly-gamma-glutamate capsule biosynthesis protein CapA/YwtB (metallophosphatase superfamily)